MNPPRALWVPYALGRPLGSAADPAFQTDVIRAALRLLETSNQPTIVDYPIEAPDEAGPGQWACPLNLEVAQASTHQDKMVAEVVRLAPWSAQTRADRGRTLFGATGADPDQVVDVARALGVIADGAPLDEAPDSPVDWAFPMPLLIRHIADDLRTYYQEAVAAQPGPSAPNHDALNDWIFSGTALGEALQVIADRLTVDGAPRSLLVRGLVIPEGHYNGGSAFPSTSEFGH